MPFSPQTTADGKPQGSDLSQAMEWMETSGRTTHLWVNNIDMDILVGPQAEHLGNGLIHTDGLCPKPERSECPQQLPRGLRAQNQHWETVMKYKLLAKKPSFLESYSHY